MFWASKRWPVKYSPHNYVEKLTSNIVWPSGSSPTFDQMGATDGEQSLLHVGNIQVLDLFRKPNSWQLFPKAQSLDQFWKLKILDVDGIEVAIPWIADLVNTSYVVISRETERFVNEIHDQKEKRTVHFDMLMDICHLKNAELEPKNQTYKGWVVLRSDIVKKTIPVLMQYLPNKVRLRLKWRPQSVLDVIARLPGCDGQAADAMSAHAQVKLEDAPRMLETPRSECPEVRICLPRREWPKSWSNIEDLVVLLERYLYGHPLAGLLWERQFEGVLFGLGWGKSTELGMSVCASKNKDSCRYSWMTSKWLDDSRMWLPCGRNWWNLSILENRRHFLTMYIWDALNVNVGRTKIIVEYREMFESRFSAGATEKITRMGEISRKNGCVV